MEKLKKALNIILRTLALVISISCILQGNYNEAWLVVITIILIDIRNNTSKEVI